MCREMHTGRRMSSSGWGEGGRRKCDQNLRVSENSVVRPVSLPSFLDNLSTMLSVHGQRGEGEDERRYIRRKAGNLGGSGELGNIQSLLYARRE